MQQHAEGSDGWAADGETIRVQAGGLSKAAVFQPEPLSGPFDLSIGVEEFDGKTRRGVVLAESLSGKPDPDNWIAIERYLFKGHTAVRVHGVRDGKPLAIQPPNLQDAQGGPSSDRLKAGMRKGIILLQNDTPRLRVMRNTVGGALHFLYADHRLIDGEVAKGWSELPTVSDREGAEYFFGVYAEGLADGQQAVFTSPTSSPMPLTDEHSADDSFAATRRGYTWAGYHGDAVVISFDERADRPDAKFVFWSEANFIPWWHLSDKVSLTYEFVEAWGGDTVGCNEPMSDHLLRWTRANIIESNAARVVVQWDYTLVTSDYEWWNNHPTIRPTVTETFTFYPDGAGVRKVTYRPPLEDHETHHKWSHELGEIIVSFAGGEHTQDSMAQPALSVYGLDAKRHDYSWDFDRPSGHEWKHDAGDWPAVIVQSNFKKGLASPFMAFGQDKQARESTAPTLPIQYGSDWELNAWAGDEAEFTDENGRKDFSGFSHWPVMKQPYDKRSWIGGTVLREPRHISLISILAGEGGAQWPVGPKERTYAMLVGLAGPNEKAKTQRKVSSWLYPGKPEVESSGFVFEANDYYERGLRFRAEDDASSELRFRVKPKSGWVNPVVIVDGWAPESGLEVALNGKVLPADKYAAAIEQDQLILWIDETVKRSATVSIQAK